MTYVPKQPTGGPQARSQRAAICRQIADGTIDLPALLMGAGPEDIERVALEIRMTQLVAAVPGIGPVKSEAILGGRGITAQTRLAATTTRTRRAIADEITKETSA